MSSERMSGWCVPVWLYVFFLAVSTVEQDFTHRTRVHAHAQYSGVHFIFLASRDRLVRVGHNTEIMHQTPTQHTCRLFETQTYAVRHVLRHMQIPQRPPIGQLDHTFSSRGAYITSPTFFYERWPEKSIPCYCRYSSAQWSARAHTCEIKPRHMHMFLPANGGYLRGQNKCQRVVTISKTVARKG